MSSRFLCMSQHGGDLSRAKRLTSLLNACSTQVVFDDDATGTKDTRRVDVFLLRIEVDGQ